MSAPKPRQFADVHEARFKRSFSVMMLMPGVIAINTIICACASVGNLLSRGSVVMSTGLELPATLDAIRCRAAPSTLTPASRNLSSTACR